MHKDASLSLSLNYCRHPSSTLSDFLQIDKKDSAMIFPFSSLSVSLSKEGGNAYQHFTHLERKFGLKTLN